MKSFRDLRTLLPAVILVTLVATVLGAGYYFGSAHTNSAKGAWDVNPIFINFSSQVGSGSVTDSLTCSPPVAPVTLLTKSNQPNIITLTASPSSFQSCGSTPNSVTVTAACTPNAQASGSCVGDFSGRVTVCGPTPYTCLGRILIVVITVTSNSNSQSALA